MCREMMPNQTWRARHVEPQAAHHASSENNCLSKTTLQAGLHDWIPVSVLAGHHRLLCRSLISDSRVKC